MACAAVNDVKSESILTLAIKKPKKKNKITL